MQSIAPNTSEVTHHVISPMLEMNGNVNCMLQSNNGGLPITTTSEQTDMVVSTPKSTAVTWITQGVTANTTASQEKTILPKITKCDTVLKQYTNNFAVVTPTTDNSPTIEEFSKPTGNQSGNVPTTEIPKSLHIMSTNITTPTIFRLPDISCNSMTQQTSNGETSSREKEAKSSLCHNYINKPSGPMRLNKFVRRLHDMLKAEQDLGIVEWRKGLLVLHSTDAFAKKVLPKYFNTKNFKTFRRQLNYYGFVHVRSFSATGTTTTALWVNQDLAKRGTGDISSVLMLKRVEPCESAKTAEGRRVRKEEAVNTVEDIGISTRAIQLEQIRNLAMHCADDEKNRTIGQNFPIAPAPAIPNIVHCDHSPNSVPSPMGDGSCTAQKSWPTASSTCLQEEAQTSQEASAKSSTDDAANLLLMLSKSIVTF